MMESEGRLFVGTFEGVNPWQKADGTPVANGLVLLVGWSRGEYRGQARFAFFEVDRDTGEPTTFARHVQSLAMQPGEKIAVRFKTAATMTGGKPYFNDEPLSVERLV